MRPFHFSAAAFACCSGMVSQTAVAQADKAHAGTTVDWRALEAANLREHVQLTFPEQFVKAGEAYFSPDSSWIIFQAVPTPKAGAAPATFYSMFVAKLRRDDVGRIVGIESPIEVSAPGSANTCGFFHPNEPGRIIFGSTTAPPAEGPAAGYQRGSNAYRWAFPEQMEVVSMIVPAIVRDALGDAGAPAEAALLFDRDFDSAAPLWVRPGYDAECAYSPDGRFIVHTRVDTATNDPDLFLFDTKTQASTPIVMKKGYDGGPFFSADGRRIAYRSDRRGDDLLQLFITDLVFTNDERGAPSVKLIEHQLTDDDQVNWAPSWHPSGSFLVYTTSRVSHANYEIFSIEAPRFGEASTKNLPRSRRLTYAPGFDGMPVFSDDGRWMMWTSQRGDVRDDEEKASSQIWIAEVVNAAPR